MRSILTLAAAAAMLAVSGCDRAITEPYGPFTGTWRYQATGFQQWGSAHDITCSIDLVFKVRQEGNSIEGRQTEPVPYFCKYPDGRMVEHGPQQGVIRGEIQDGRIHFSNAGNWHSFGEVGSDRVEGYLESYGGTTNGQVQAHRSGSFVLERISGEGYYGPEA
ncbi:MAG: hypothetical protein AVDCRST_MAG68-244 [uncultured Gemmatimonadetes bacterium]|uniref:Lipocalin-like domain-containing protein n=1 Tax=uncultured Gemmatimonadota bacterium TaxID=203437 RepID=A0A6J4K8X8_9BACT|nr:MAG: hypothetical protein AVDCRST_MAG68-244 [uncultured Gemmatimonadota bacterium]